MASVSTNKLGSLAEQSVEEPTSGAPKLEAMVEVKFKVRKLAVLLKAEENVTPTTTATIASSANKILKTTVTMTKMNNDKSVNSNNYGFTTVKKSSGPAAMSQLVSRTTTTTTAATVTALVQHLQYEARQYKVESSSECSTFIVGHKIERGHVENAAVQQSSVQNKVKRLNNGNLEYPVHDWGVPKNFVVELPNLPSFEHHLSEAKRLESSLVLERPAKFLLFQRVSRKRILVDALDDAKLKKDQGLTTAKTISKKTAAELEKHSSNTSMVKSIINSKTPQASERNQKQSTCENLRKTKAAVASEEVNQFIDKPGTQNKKADLTTATKQPSKKVNAIIAGFQQNQQDKAPQKCEKTLTAALDLALLGQTKFQLKCKRSTELRKSALKCYAKAQVKRSIREWHIETCTSNHNFSKWETSESLQLLKSKKRVSSRLSFLEKHFGKERQQQKVHVKKEFVENRRVKQDPRKSSSTFFDLQILDNEDDDNSLSDKEDGDYTADCISEISETKSSPEPLETICAAEDVIYIESNVTLANEESVKELSSKEEKDLVSLSLKPTITHEKFLMKLIEGLSTPEDVTNGQEVELLYLRKTPFIEDDEELLMPEKPFKVATTNPNKYLMELLESKKHITDEDALIDIDAESDDWDEELDPDVDGIEFFDSEDHDYEVDESNDVKNVVTQAIAPCQPVVTVTDEISCVGTKIFFGNITQAEFQDECNKAKVITQNKGEIKPMIELALVPLSRFHVVPNTPEPQSNRKYINFTHHDDDERPSCSKFRDVANNRYTIKYKTIPLGMNTENEKLEYQTELQSVLKKIRLLSEVDDLDQSCVYQEVDTEQRLYMKKNGEWFATEPSESDDENRIEKRALEQEPANAIQELEPPRTFTQERFALKRLWMLSELRKRFGLKTARYDPTKKRPGMIIDSENWEEAYSEATFWNAHKNSFEKVRVLAKKGRFKFAIISEAKQNRKAETSDEGEETDKSSSEEEKDGGKSLQRKHSSFEIRQADCKRGDDGEVFFQPINCRGLLGAKCNDRRWALPPSRIYRFSRSFGRILKLYMKRPDLETILEEREPNEDSNEECDFEQGTDTGPEFGVKGKQFVGPVSASAIENKVLQLGFTCEETQNVVKTRKKLNEDLTYNEDYDDYDNDEDDDDEYVISTANSTKTTSSTTSNEMSKHIIVDWYYCFYNEHTDEPADEDYFGDLSDFE